MSRLGWHLSLVYCAAVWGATFYLVKDAIGEVDPVVLVGYRFLLAAALLVPAAAARRKSLAAAALLRGSAGLAALLVLLYVTQTVGLGWTSASNSGFITGLFILWVPALLYALRLRRPTPSQRAAVALALAGLWLLTGGLHGFNRGDAITLVSAFAYAAHLLLTDRCVREGLEPVGLAFHQFWMTGAASLCLAGAMGSPLGVASARTAGVIAFLAAVPTFSAFFIQLKAQRHVDPVRVSLIFSTEPVFAALFAWTLGGETFRLRGAAGGALIVVAMAVSDLSAAEPAA